ncbi:MAG: 2-oxoglutarate dehydrogenase complex dihydrolipoyllysine-residue succinyltransferase [Phycisphaeraceae bacterium]|nr:2-oxoglutarate dehydrogenase complex dihydrolipoyllysine-residue succinyltransferase [Phycisphaeraceae bacterium]
MPTNIVIPEMGESVTQGVIAAWRKKPGEFVRRDETVLELETDKITAEIPAPASGVLQPGAREGETVKVGAIVGRIDEAAEPSPAAASAPTPAAPANAAPSASPSAPAAANGHAGSADVRATPLARKLAEEHGVALSSIEGTGAGGRIREQDVLDAVAARRGGSQAVAAAPAIARPSQAAHAPEGGIRREKMSQLRQRIAARLVEAQHTAAMLTTFNECDMSAVMDLRKQYKETFEKKHGIGLGFMSFFVKAVVNAVRAFPLVNASIVQNATSGELEIEHHDGVHVAVAVGTPKGLVVPVLRNCETLSFAAIEQGIKDLAIKARDGKLTLNDMQGGTFTITNGGIYGSLMSTPILNPPQCGILGMHAIKNRAVEDPKHAGQVVIRPMMYLALSYDHRLVDGAEAVQFLVTIKNCIEDPTRLMLGV